MRTLLLTLLVLTLVFTIGAAAFTPTVAAGDAMSYEDPCDPNFGLAGDSINREAPAAENPGPPDCLH